MTGNKITSKIQISGIVQGVGFRPFIYNLARSFGITGYVLNHSAGVEIIAQGTAIQVNEFIAHIVKKAPPQAVIDNLASQPVKERKNYADFIIQKSRAGEQKVTRISPDLCVCGQCRAELLDANNRRYYYPFINCTNCGPRYTIIKDVPYDRPQTTMCGFKMCARCQSEYDDPANRRFHAQPNACHVCGPHLQLLDKHGVLLFKADDAVSMKELTQKTADLLDRGKIIAIKGIGGYHLACNALNQQAVLTLRLRKYREHKPFAIMVKNIAAAEKIARLNRQEKERLQRFDRPILLLAKSGQCNVAAAVSPENKYLGIMLPYAPFHYLLFEHVAYPLVMTSANISEEPIAHTNEDALNRLNHICDYYITGNRDIHIRCDDSVLRIWQGNDYPLRRSRGIAPNPIAIDFPPAASVLAVGAEQKNTVCLAKRNMVVLSHHIGDLKNMRTLHSFHQAIEHLGRTFDINPKILAHDLHPQYLSTQFALNPPHKFSGLQSIQRVAVQHHHAHVASCMAEHGLTKRVIGITLDGTGYGADGTVWGGEVLIADLLEFRRAACLQPAVMPGMELAIKNPWRMGLSYLYGTYGDAYKQYLPQHFKQIPKQQIQMAIYQIKTGINSPLTSSCGRLFDGVAALSGKCIKAYYEGQPAVEWEQLIDDSARSCYALDLEKRKDLYYIKWQSLIKEIMNQLKHSVPLAVIARGFHMALVSILLRVCQVMQKETGIRQVVLSGGCFMNMFLLGRLTEVLNENGFKVFNHQKVPCNDGGISLGQAVIAAHRAVKHK